VNASRVASRSSNEPQRDLFQFMDVVRDDAAMELEFALRGVSVMRIKRANVPGASAYGFSRAMNGSESNPLYRIAALFILLKRMGVPREVPQRIVDWLQDLINRVWGPAEETKEEAGSADRIGTMPRATDADTPARHP
jgi:hypothetical protein